MTFLEFAGGILLFLLITQVVIPALSGGYIRYFWFFKKKKPTEDAPVVKATVDASNIDNEIDQAEELKTRADEKITNVEQMTEEQLRIARDRDERLKKLKS